MARTISNGTGDGVTADLINVSIQLPDSGNSVAIGGRVQKVGQTIQTITGSPITFPAAPGAGIINVVIQVDYTTGIASIKQNTSAGTMPTVDANNLQVFQTVLQTTDSVLSLDSDNITPDTY